MSTGQSPLRSLPPITAASIATAFIMYPVDVARALGMASATGEKVTLTQFIATHGVKGLFSQGIGPEIGRASLMRVMKFFNFPIVHRALTGLEPEKGTTVSRAMSGALATVPECLVITPIELAKIGLQLDSTSRFKNNSSQFTKHMTKVRGPVGLYTGYFGIQFRQSAWTGTYFATLPLYQGLFGSGFSALEESTGMGDGSLASVAKFCSGFGAGVTGAAVNCPGDVIRTNIQKAAIQETLQSKEALAKLKPYSITPAHLVGGVTEFFAMGARIAAEKGVLGLWSGFGFKAAHLGGGGALLAWLIPTFTKLFYGDTKK